ncbi:MAG: prepilin-type N-terminal cleavage/methylation domain-containing protein [Clostridia bacterium]|nr:prepilin-type N-terminal cleavage/methylation domain-containing protein [Clostridia bacterium]
MKKYVKSRTKRGFTLLELMLAIAIMMITMESIFSLIISTYSSHREVGYMNCCTELLEINSTALETHMLGFLGSPDKSVEYTCKNACVCANGNPIVDVSSIPSKTGGPKFHIEVEFKDIEAEKVTYIITVMDNESNTKYGSINKTVWLPHASNGSVVISGGGSSLKISK